MASTWFDRVKTCVGWDAADQERIAGLRHCLDSDFPEVIETLSKQLIQFKGVQLLMTNARFIRHLHNVLREWLMGVLHGAFDEEYAQARRTFAQSLIELDLTSEDVILLGTLARRELFELAQERLNGCPQELPDIMVTLDRALCLDLAVIHNGYTQAHDAEIERSLLDRFLAVTGFSRTLYENLAETRERRKAGL